MSNGVVCVQRLLMVLIMLLCSFVTNIVFAETILTGERHIPYIAGKRSKNKVVVEKYKFYLSGSTRVRLHFISYVRNNVSFKLIETETENAIDVLSKELDIDNSPFTQEVDLNAGKYTFIVYKEPSYGSVHNTGEYRFTFDKVELSRSLPEKAGVDGDKHNVMKDDGKNFELENVHKENNKLDKIARLNIGIAILGGVASIFGILASTKLNFMVKSIIAIIVIMLMVKYTI